MLPPRLQQVKSKIEAKSQNLRSQGEKELLIELEALDQSAVVQKVITESLAKYVSGPTGGRCPCCGR